MPKSLFPPELFLHQIKPQSSWLRGVCLIEFDNDIGNNVTASYPENEFSEQELLDIAFLGLPPTHPSAPPNVDSTHFFNLDSPILQVPKPLCAAYWSRRKDPSAVRKTRQTALVVCANLPAAQLLHTLLLLAGPPVMREGLPALERLWLQALRWPHISIPGMQIFPVLDQSFRWSSPLIAHASASLRCGRTLLLAAGTGLLRKDGGAVNGETPYSSGIRLLAPRLLELCLAVLCGCTVLVMGDRADQVSEMCLCVASLSYPLPWPGHLLPFIDMGCSAFDTLPPPAGVVGGSHPFLEKQAAQFDVVIRLGSRQTKKAPFLVFNSPPPPMRRGKGGVSLTGGAVQQDQQAQRQVTRFCSVFVTAGLAGVHFSRPPKSLLEWFTKKQFRVAMERYSGSRARALSLVLGMR
eukprot:gnl/Dysnectes_brevis/5455_a7855_214.p1 GENE.gnl/Dysnectes_brevis/5455_a7855_214~~gnl/Dysnectes_brevis/5455_a7855_214.p1  ORF type:complete len:408 (+),score=149.06 gnl/Dysnectes_brevis/5455_a7855_214:95-1318(+)